MLLKRTNQKFSHRLRNALESNAIAALVKGFIPFLPDQTLFMVISLDFCVEFGLLCTYKMESCTK